VVDWWESQFRPFFSDTASALLLRVSRAVSCKLNNCLKGTDRVKRNIERERDEKFFDIYSCKQKNNKL